MKIFLVCQPNLCYYIFSSTGQDEDMDTTPLAQAQPFFVIDKEKKSGSDERRDEGNDSDGEQDEDPDSCVEDEEELEDVSATNKASTDNGRVENGASHKTNGKHHSESEESSEEEDQEEETTVKKTKGLPVSSAQQCQTFASWQESVWKQ